MTNMHKCSLLYFELIKVLLMILTSIVQLVKLKAIEIYFNVNTVILRLTTLPSAVL